MEALSVPPPSWMTEDLTLLREQARKFLASELVPHVDAWHEKGIMDRSAWNKLGEAGLLCAGIEAGDLEQVVEQRLEPVELRDQQLGAAAECGEQLLAGRARPVKTETAAKSSTTGCIHPCRVRYHGRRIRPREYPVWCLTVPDERVPDDVHVVAQAEIHIGIRRPKIVTVRAFPRMDELPLQIILGGNLVKLFFDGGNVPLDLFQSPVRPDRIARGNRAVNGNAHVEIILVSIFEGGLVGRPGRCADGKQY